MPRYLRRYLICVFVILVACAAYHGTIYWIERDADHRYKEPVVEQDGRLMRGLKGFQAWIYYVAHKSNSGGTPN
jgi:hypothetical protein